jgi:hypothetical protein
MTTRRRGISPARAVGVPLAVVVLTAVASGCGGGAPVALPTAGPTVSSEVAATTLDVSSASPSATPNTSGSASALPGSTSSTSPVDASGDATAPPGTVPLPTAFTPLDKSVSDTVVGHTVKVTQISRQLEWPAGYRDQAAAFELIAVQMTWTAGAKMTAPLSSSALAVISGSAFPNRRDTVLDATMTAAGWPVLPMELAAGQTATGWMVFKVEPKGATVLKLQLTRPAVRDTTTKKTYAKEIVTVQIVG